VAYGGPDGVEYGCDGRYAGCPFPLVETYGNVWFDWWEFGYADEGESRGTKCVGDEGRLAERAERPECEEVELIELVRFRAWVVFEAEGRTGGVATESEPARERCFLEDAEPRDDGGDGVPTWTDAFSSPTDGSGLAAVEGGVCLRGAEGDSWRPSPSRVVEVARDIRPPVVELVLQTPESAAARSLALAEATCERLWEE
jgi:hypothetical protein